MLPPGLSMLWETVDPEAALRERFGFESVDALTSWVSTVLGRTWRIAVRRCSRVVISSQNAIVWVDSDRGPLVVKWSRDQARFAGLAATTRLLRPIAERGLPVAAPIATATGLDRVTLEGPAGALSVTVLPQLTGEWLDVTDRAAVHGAGATLAKLHEALGAAVPQGLTPTPPPGPADRIGEWLIRWDRGLAPAASRRLEAMLVGLPELTDEPQLVHNDFRAANILTRDSTVVGVLDFDEALVAHRVSDLAKACVYLGTRFTDWRPTPRSVRATLCAGYASVRPLEPAEAQWLGVLVLWQGIIAVPAENDPAGWASATAW